jgi:preprotein translocase subunit SecA
MLAKIFKKLSGSHYRKFYRKSQPVVARINALEQEYQALSDEQLQAKTLAFRERLKGGESLDDILPEAFATVKNAARRLCGREIEYVGTRDVWNMVHFDVQLIGGMALHNRMIAEMATGEGKTLVATLPLYLNALAGRGAQLVTVNEYLAQRDAEWMGHLYKFLGLTVGVIKNQQSPPDKREAYNCDITYGTASEFGFDYLRDNGMATTHEQLVQRDHFFCIVDEVDSILIDEARTPLIISGPVQTDTVAPYMELKGSIEGLARQQVQLCNRLINDAKTQLEKESSEWEAENKERDRILRENDKKQKENRARAKRGEELLELEPVPRELDPYALMWQVKQGMPKNKVLLRLLEDGSTRKAFDAFDLEMAGDYNKVRRYNLKEELFFTLDEKQRSSDLTQRGRDYLRPEDPDAFVMPDLPTKYMEIDANTSLEPAEKAKAKAEEQTKFEQASEMIHCIGQLLRAYSLYERDVEYVVQDGKVMIVDENTGRVMPGRRWSDGLHQAIEAKEGVQIEKESKTYATITLQNYFRLYEKLAGMTGTAETEANEFKDIYRIDVMVVPTNQPSIRIDENDIIYKTRREKYNAVVDEIEEAQKRGQPCLVGTVSVESSELLSRMLKRKQITHSVLNAKFHAQEAEIVARAGQPGSVTIATNMAGRGTDIKLGAGVAEVGGLYVIGTERHTSRRIDRQLRGRCARQGDPGKTRFFLSLEDELMRLYSQGSAGKLLESSFEEGEPLEHRWLNPMIERAQKTVEQHHYSIRKRLLQYDDVGSRQREVIYGLRHDALTNEAPKEIIFELIEEELQAKADEFNVGRDDDDKKQESNFCNWACQTFPVILKAEEIIGKPREEAVTLTLARIREAYDVKEATEDADAMRRLERFVIISAIDRNYQNLLTEMEDLRQSVGLRGYGQKDPLVEYKNEAFVYFEQMMNQVRSDVCTGIFRSVTNVRALEELMTRLRGRSVASGPSGPDGDQGGSGGAPVGAAAGGRPGKDIQLPKIERVPVRVANEPKRNDTVTIQKAGEKQTLKWKKAERLVKEEGWQLIQPK